jgi:two-component system cell cycle response regulator
MTGRREHPVTTDHSRPRRNVFRRLLFSMLALGVIAGVAFPLFTNLVVGVDAEMMPVFMFMCVAAGLAVGAANFALFDIVVTREISRLANGMRHINAAVENPEDVDAASGSDCLLQVISNDLIGELTRCFNSMTEAVGRRVNVESTTRRLLASLSSTVELGDVAATVLEALASMCGGRAGLLYADTGAKLVLIGSFGVDLTEDVPNEIGGQHGLAQRAMSLRRAEWVVPNDEGLEWVEISCPLGSFRPNALLLAPLVSDHKSMTGLAVLAAADRGLTPERELLIESIRTAAAPYVQNAVLHKKLEELAAIDELTHMLNRRFGMRRLREEFSRSTRHGVPLSVIMFDIDHFKEINDSFGHDAGDAVLQAVASALESNVRAGDVACRYGGEEFLVVAPGMGLADACKVSDRLRRTVETRPVSWRDQVLHVTVSAGVATWPVTRPSVPEDLVTCADNALYHAKESGRDRVSIHDGDRVTSATSLSVEVEP